MSTVTPIDTLNKLDQMPSATPDQKTGKDAIPEPSLPSASPVSPGPIQKPNLVAMVTFTRKEAAAIMTGLLNGLLTEENFEPKISFPVDRIQLGTPKV